MSPPRTVQQVRLQSFALPVGEVQNSLVIAPDGVTQGLGLGIHEVEGEQHVILALHSSSGTTLFVQLDEEMYDRIAQRFAVLGLAQMDAGRPRSGLAN